MADLLAIDDRADLSSAPELVLGPEEDVRLHAGLGNHRVIGIAFPSWRDGRGYSSARILRQQGFEGDVRAIGDLTVDQLVFLKRSGFSSVAAERKMDRDVATRAMARYEFVYQAAEDDRLPAWALRHGVDAV